MTKNCQDHYSIQNMPIWLKVYSKKVEMRLKSYTCESHSRMFWKLTSWFVCKHDTYINWRNRIDKFEIPVDTAIPKIEVSYTTTNR